MLPLISVIVPVYNVEKYIIRCIESVINQDYINLEIIVINDGSNDKSFDIIESFNDSRINIFNKINTGASDTRNFGLEKATGDYVYFLDSDDWIENNLISSCVKQIEINKPDIIYFNYYTDTYYDDFNLIKSCSSELHQIKDNDPKMLNVAGFVWNKIYKLTFLRNNEITFDKTLTIYEDVDFNLKSFSKTKNISFLNETFYHYANRQVSTLIKSYNNKNINCFNIVQDSLNHFLFVCNYSNEIRFEIRCKFILTCLRHQLNTIIKYSNLNFINRIKNIQILLNDLNNLKDLKSFKVDGFKSNIIKYLSVNNHYFLLNLLLSIKK